MFARMPARAARPLMGAVAIACLLAAPAMANVEVPDYPTAIAADAADMMAKYGGVVIDVESRFAAPAPDYFGCGTVKHEAKTSADKRTFNYTACAVPTVKVYTPPSVDIGQGNR